MKKTIALVSALALPTAPAAFAEHHAYDAISPDYIAGFLAGADLTDGAIIDNISSGNESEFILRAYRTRLGKEHPAEQSTYLAGFCLPEGATQDSLISSILDKLSHTPRPDNTQRDVFLYNIIKSLYPCQD
ncbi:hypothetical protein SAMN03080615_02288 [Amphritea atlantica]|jgi:hypothetical protein|uniref:Rap1a immunity protein domain-containing protein n=1 Tax=Amphritea atlantica TaxID=355243 RepID=A0A1H9HXH4_9GAMM|nr:Rap1a/Tai family immunity protein [Amphritea atlantica]SEQ67056.1 hypothetical protein SAMN03080615_02288 [Amphritea atlantica]